MDLTPIRQYDHFARQRYRPALETADVRRGLFGKARIVRPTSDNWSADEQWDVLVAGGGPAGMLHGALLARRGHSVLVVERNDQLARGVTWNICREEFDDLARTEAFTSRQLRELVVGEFRDGRFRLYDPSAGSERREFHFPYFLSVSLDETAFMRFLRETDGLTVRTGMSAELLGVTRDAALVACEGPEGRTTVRCRLLLDARGWMSPLAALVHPGRRMESAVNIVGVHASRLPRESDDSGTPLGLICVTCENETRAAEGMVQPIFERFSDNTPLTGEEGEVVYYFTRTARPARLEPLVGEMLAGIQKIAPGFREELVDRLYWGHTPAYHPYLPHSPWSRQTSAGDRTLLVGYAAQQVNGLTGCAFGALVRNAVDISAAVDDLLRRDRLTFRFLNRVDADPRERPSQEVVELFSGVMALAPWETPGTVNRDWISFMEVADRIPPRFRAEAFRDKIRLGTLNRLMGICAGRPGVVAALLRNNRGRLSQVAWTFLSAYVRLLAIEIGLVARRRRRKYVTGSIGGLVRLPFALARAARLVGTGFRIDHRRHPILREGEGHGGR